MSEGTGILLLFSQIPVLSPVTGSMREAFRVLWLCCILIWVLIVLEWDSLCKNWSSVFTIYTVCFITLFSSVQSLSCFRLLWPHGLQHARLPCPSPTPRVYSNSCPLSQWCHPTSLSSVIPFSSHLQSFPASGSFQMSQLFISGGRSIGVSASTSVLPMNIQDWFPLGWTGWISLESQRLSRVFSNTTVQKHPFFGAQLSL